MGKVAWQRARQASSNGFLAPWVLRAVEFVKTMFDSYLIVSAGMRKTKQHPKTLQLAGCRAGSYTGGPANWRFLRWLDRWCSPSLAFKSRL